MKEDWMRMTLRIPVPLRDWLTERTLESRRSLNGEIVHSLEAWRQQCGSGGSGAPAAGEASQA